MGLSLVRPHLDGLGLCRRFLDVWLCCLCPLFRRSGSTLERGGMGIVPAVVMSWLVAYNLQLEIARDGAKRKVYEWLPLNITHDFRSHFFRYVFKVSSCGAPHVRGM